MFNRLQKLVSQLAVLGIEMPQEDLNSKFLRSLPFEWAMHVVVWKNKRDIDSMDLMDLYSNFKIVEHEVKKSAGSSSSSSSGNLAFVSTPSSSSPDEEVQVGGAVGTANANLGTASTSSSTSGLLNDDTYCAFLTTQHNGSMLTHSDLQEIDEDDIEEMDIKWQLSLLSLRARRFLKKTGKKIVINSNDVAGYDKSKIECYNCHKKGHYSRECRLPSQQDGKSRAYGNKSRVVEVTDSSSKAMVAIDGLGFDWSYIAEEEADASIEIALMAYSDSEVQVSKCS